MKGHLRDIPEFTGLPLRDSAEGRSWALEFEGCHRRNRLQPGEEKREIVYLPPTLFKNMGRIPGDTFKVLVLLFWPECPRAEEEFAESAGLSVLRFRRVLEAIAADGWVSQRTDGTWELVCDSTGSSPSS